VRLRLRPVIDGLQAPLQVTHAGDGSGRLFIVEQGGVVRVARNGRVGAEPFLDLSGRTEGQGEQGLLGLAFHPRYEQNGRLFVNYTDNAGDTVVAEYRTSAQNENRALASSEQVLLHIDQPFPNHNGGHVVFGPDGYLYIGMGDGGSAGDPMGNGQRLDTLLGKILRIDVDARAGDGYAVPADNPFVEDAQARPEIWALGLRNPWRFSFDTETGTLWTGDVGQSELEEIDRVAADRAGLNYGWNTMEGTSCFTSETCNESRFVAPIAVYSHEQGCSVTGGFVYRGRDFPSLLGGYVFGDYCSGKIWAVDASGPQRQKPVELLDTDRLISSFGVDEEGELYVTDLEGGMVLQVTAAPD
jgi:glucose/arabinose dehydrogenase